VSELETAEVGDLDEHRRAIRVRWTVEKNERYRHLDLPDDLFAAILTRLPAREDRIWTRRSFPTSTRPRCGRRSPEPVKRPGRRTSRPTASAVGVARSTTSGRDRWPRSPSYSGTPSGSPLTTTCTR
jgi:hypothetical protein